MAIPGSLLGSLVPLYQILHVWLLLDPKLGFHSWNGGLSLSCPLLEKLYSDELVGKSTPGPVEETNWFLVDGEVGKKQGS